MDIGLGSPSILGCAGGLLKGLASSPSDNNSTASSANAATGQSSGSSPSSDVSSHSFNPGCYHCNPLGVGLNGQGQQGQKMDPEKAAAAAQKRQDDAIQAYLEADYEHQVAHVEEHEREHQSAGGETAGGITMHKQPPGKGRRGVVSGETAVTGMPSGPTGKESRSQLETMLRRSKLVFAGATAPSDMSAQDSRVAGESMARQIAISAALARFGSGAGAETKQKPGQKLDTAKA